MSVGGGPVQAHGVESLAPAVAGVIRAPGVTVPRHERIVLDNGMRLIVLPRHDVPLVSFNAILRGGECAGAAGKAGVASLVAGLLEKGAGSRNAFEFADAVEVPEEYSAPERARSQSHCEASFSPATAS